MSTGTGRPAGTSGHTSRLRSTVITDALAGYRRRPQAVQRDVVPCVDERGGPGGHKRVYSCVFAAVLASMRGCARALSWVTRCCSTSVRASPTGFPDLMAAAIERNDVGRWAAREGITAVRG